MKLQNLIVIFILIIVPIILLTSLYISTGLKTINLQTKYDTGLLTATHDAIYAFESNTVNDSFSNNPERKRDIIKASIKLYEKSLCNACGISAYNTSEIEEYVPAIAFGMYDGFYMYSPSLNPKTNKYEHGLKNYVYYSETLSDGTIIRYSLDNYVVVYGPFGENGKWETKSGYLIDLTDSSSNGTKYKGINIDSVDTDAINYYKEAYEFTNWFLNTAKFKEKYLTISEENDPENGNSAFVQHKRKVMKDKIESVLNSSITAYSERTGGYNYKMPKLLEEDWQKIYSNISMITFFQGKSIGLTKYNGYCVLNSTNNNEYVNPNLMYFIDNNNEYHDIRCERCKEATSLSGYKIGSFQKIKLEKKLDIKGKQLTDLSGNLLYDDGTQEGTTNKYKYNHSELACYSCINGQLENAQLIYDYIKPNVRTADAKIKTAYWTSLARERYNTTKTN